MKTNIIFATLFALFFAITAQAAITITEETQTSFDEAMENTISWTSRFQAGSNGTGSNSYEVYVSSNGLQAPQYGNFDWWDTVNTINVSYDAAGNVYAGVSGKTITVVGAPSGSGPVDSLVAQSVNSFSEIWIKIRDTGTVGSTSLEDILVFTTLNSGNTANESFEYLKVSLDEPDQVFSLSADFSRAFDSTGSESYVEFYGINNIPEPSSVLLVTLFSLLLILRRNRN